jgi:hypothetical protein
MLGMGVTGSLKMSQEFAGVGSNHDNVRHDEQWLKEYPRTGFYARVRSQLVE